MSQTTTIRVSPADRRRLEAMVADRHSPQKLVWRNKTKKPGTMPLLPAVVDHVHRPFVWTADLDRIIKKVRRRYERLRRMGERRAM